MTLLNFLFNVPGKNALKMSGQRYEKLSRIDVMEGKNKAESGVSLKGKSRPG